MAAVLRAVRRDGDTALVRFTERFDGVRLGHGATSRVGSRRSSDLARRRDHEVVGALGDMAKRIEAYHRRQLTPGFRLRLPGGSVLEEVVRPLDSVGLYVPGGAGRLPVLRAHERHPRPCRGRPADRRGDAAPRARRQPRGGGGARGRGPRGRGLPRGGRAGGGRPRLRHAHDPARGQDRRARATPSWPRRSARSAGTWRSTTRRGRARSSILADDSADAGFVAADLLAQAEHGSGDETVVLVTPSAALAEEVRRLVAEGAPSVANVRAARSALARNARGRPRARPGGGRGRGQRASPPSTSR